METDNGRSDPVLDELHAVRRQLLAESGGTLESLVARIQRHETESGRRFAKIPAVGRPQSFGVSGSGRVD